MSTALDSLTLRVQAEQIAAHDESRLGRPSTLADPDTIQVLLAAITDGNYRETACKIAGIHKANFYRWLEQADNGDERAQAFRAALEKAEAAAESQMVQAVRRAGELPQYWAAAATHLERKFPDRWGRRDESAVTAKVQVRIGGVDARQVLIGVQVGRGEGDRGEGDLSPTTFALNEGRNSPPNSLSQQTYAESSRLINGDYVNLSESVPAADMTVSKPPPVAAPAPESQIPAQGFAGDPTPIGRAPGEMGSSRVKGRAMRRKEKKAGR